MTGGVEHSAPTGMGVCWGYALRPGVTAGRSDRLMMPEGIIEATHLTHQPTMRCISALNHMVCVMRSADSDPARMASILDFAASPSADSLNCTPMPAVRLP